MIPHAASCLVKSPHIPSCQLLHEAEALAAMRGLGPSTAELRQKEESRQAYAAALRQQLVDNESRNHAEPSEARVRKAEAADRVSPSGGQQLGLVGFGPSTVELRQKEESRQAYAAALRQQLVDKESRNQGEPLV